MATQSNITLGVSHYVCPAGTSLTEFLDQISAAGFDSIGLTVKALNELPLTQLRAELKARDLGVSSVNTAGYFFESSAPFADQADLNLRLLDAAAELDAANGVNLIVGSSDQLALTESRKIALEKSVELAAQAKSRGTRLLLEPMHPLQARGKGCVNTLAHASQWLKAIPALSLNVDLFHSWWDPDLERALSGEMGSVGVLQVCDVLIATGTCLPSRAPLGEGGIDWYAAAVHALATWPDMPIELEWFADQLPHRDALSLMRADAQQMRQLRSDDR